MSYITGPAQQRLGSEEPPCFRWPMAPLLSAAVSVTQMGAAAPAQEAFARACRAVRKKDWPEAEQYLNRAVALYPKFAAAWVLLGQTQQDQQKAEQAARSCTQARDVDATFLPSYLCLADLAARQEKWTEVADLTNLVLASHPVRAPGAYYYNSLAYFYLKQGVLAEQSALRAIEDGGHEQKPQIHWLLAKIYEEKGDRASEAAQLRQYLKLAPHAPDASIARHILEEIKRQTPEAAATTGKAAENK